MVASTAIAAAQRRLGGYDHGNPHLLLLIVGGDYGRDDGDDCGNGYDHDCCGSTTAAIMTLAMVTIAPLAATMARAHVTKSIKRTASSRAQVELEVG